jgi:hypothetical protein
MRRRYRRKYPPRAHFSRLLALTLVSKAEIHRIALELGASRWSFHELVDFRRDLTRDFH